MTPEELALVHSIIAGIVELENLVHATRIVPGFLELLQRVLLASEKLVRLIDGSSLPEQVAGSPRLPP